MDGTLCDFIDAHDEALLKNPKQPFPHSSWGFFLDLKPLEGAIEGFKELEKYFEVWILTRPSAYNINCYSEKAKWVLDYLGFDVLEKTILCCDKSKVIGDYLIDDMGNAGQDKFIGEWIQFGSEKFKNWKMVVDYILEKERPLVMQRN